MEVNKKHFGKVHSVNFEKELQEKETRISKVEKDRTSQGETKKSTNFCFLKFGQKALGLIDRDQLENAFMTNRFYFAI